MHVGFDSCFGPGSAWLNAAIAPVPSGLCLQNLRFARLALELRNRAFDSSLPVIDKHPIIAEPAYSCSCIQFLELQFSLLQLQRNVDIV